MLVGGFSTRSDPLGLPNRGWYGLAPVLGRFDVVNPYQVGVWAAQQGPSR